MLAAWLRIKYPDTFHGAIAASAPLGAFPGTSAVYDTNTYWQVVTRDASPEAGSAPACIDNVRRAWTELFKLADSKVRQLGYVLSLDAASPLCPSFSRQRCCAGPGDSLSLIQIGWPRHADQDISALSTLGDRAGLESGHVLGHGH